MYYITTDIPEKNNRRFVKYVSENVTFIMCFYTCNVFWVGMGSKSYSTGVQIVKRASKNYCIFWQVPKNRGAYYYCDYYCRLQRSRLLISIIFIYIIYISIYAIYTLYIEKERDWSFCHIQILDWVLCYLLVPIIFMRLQRLFSPQIYIFKGSLLYYKINEDFCT